MWVFKCPEWLDRVEWLDGINLEEVLRATAMAWCWLARGLPRGPDPSQKMESVSALLKSSPQAGISYIRRRLFLNVRILFHGKESIVEAEEEHYTILTNGDRALNRYCVIGCCLQVENTTFFKHLLL